jgi:hypothetical protein
MRPGRPSRPTDKVLQGQGLHELHDILPERHQLPAPHGPVIPEAGGPRSAQIGREGAIARLDQALGHPVPGVRIIRPAVQEKDRRAFRPAPFLVGHVEDGSLNRTVLRWHDFPLQLRLMLRQEGNQVSCVEPQYGRPQLRRRIRTPLTFDRLTPRRAQGERGREEGRAHCPEMRRRADEAMYFR